MTKQHPLDVIAGHLQWAQDSTPVHHHSKLKNNTVAGLIYTEPLTIGVRVHDTWVVSYIRDHGTWTCKLQTGGFYSKLTMTRINEYIPEGFYVEGTLATGYGYRDRRFDVIDNEQRPPNFRPWRVHNRLTGFDVLLTEGVTFPVNAPQHKFEKA